MPWSGWREVPNFVTWHGEADLRRVRPRDHGIAEITPGLMDTARTELGLEGM
jgi:hypothetical protein